MNTVNICLHDIFGVAVKCEVIFDPEDTPFANGAALAVSRSCSVWLDAEGQGCATLLPGNYIVRFSGITSNTDTLHILVPEAEGDYRLTDLVVADAGGSSGGEETVHTIPWDQVTGKPALEPALGKPDTDGKVLSSTAAGVRSWVPLPVAGSGGSPTLTPQIAYIEITGDDATAAIGNPKKPFSSAQAAYNAAFAISNNTLLQFGLGNWSINVTDADWPSRISIAGPGKWASVNVGCTLTVTFANGTDGVPGTNATVTDNGDGTYSLGDTNTLGTAPTNARSGIIEDALGESISLSVTLGAGGAGAANGSAVQGPDGQWYGNEVGVQHGADASNVTLINCFLPNGFSTAAAGGSGGPHIYQGGQNGVGAPGAMPSLTLNGGSITDATINVTTYPGADPNNQGGDLTNGGTINFWGVTYRSVVNNGGTFNDNGYNRVQSYTKP